MPIAICQKRRNISTSLDGLAQSCTLSFESQSPRLALACPLFSPLYRSTLRLFPIQGTDLSLQRHWERQSSWWRETGDYRSMIVVSRTVRVETVSLCHCCRRRKRMAWQRLVIPSSTASQWTWRSCLSECRYATGVSNLNDDCTWTDQNLNLRCARDDNTPKRSCLSWCIRETPWVVLQYSIVKLDVLIDHLLMSLRVLKVSIASPPASITTPCIPFDPSLTYAHSSVHILEGRMSSPGHIFSPLLTQ